MELVLAVTLVVAVGALTMLAGVRARAKRAEDTLRTISDLVSDGAVERVKGAELVGRVRTLADHDTAVTLSADRYRAALEEVAIGIAVVSPDGTIEFGNRAAKHLIDGTGDWAVLATRVGTLARNVVKSGEAEGTEVDMHDPDRRVIVLRATPLLGADATVAAVAVYLDDRTDERRLTAMRKDFVANASHELKTPLGALSLLAETLGYADDEEKRAVLASRLKTEAERMANVVDDILTLARTEALVSQRAAIDTEEMINEVVDSVAGLARSQQIDLVDGGVQNLEVVVDAKQVMSAVRNLMDNAITYTAAKGMPGTVTYRCRLENDRACIEVEDTGIGIPSRYTDRVFERFFRIDQARSRESGGTGLGLSIVRNVAKAHGGSVSVRSTVGVGTTMSMCLPLAPTNADDRADH
jgi:two-component system sensor histidine kinase SenX3